MSATRMLVLGIIRGAGPAHGYKVRAELMGWNAQEWARINPGSIYHAIRKAAADGLLVEAPDDAREAGPDRMRYAVTEAGERELRELVRAGLRVTRDPFMLNAAVAMLPVLERAEAVAALDERLAELRTAVAELESWGDRTPYESPEHVIEQVRLWLAQVRADIDWSSGLRRRLLDGAYRMADD
ncbi:PadR family transcriptional regulator [Actinokineospora sp. UTMC 2448]|uniref:PadR family transcriptional regulator n=1 Tax=Actinokineospora sp. UTMC 2448 TaxID=2268449 RepID=UPI002164208C|nr:PadR family transcriptional regulator [Actinokineospora sp. UTMC 2448]UVS76943.1 transcriptional regulator, Acidobacterial, PadR-family [Actinokineospora sp. UTMC 2448]